MRPYEDWRRNERIQSARSERVYPALDEQRLARAPAKQRRAHIQEEGPALPQSDRAAERRAIRRRGPAEPLVETLRPGDDHPFRRHTMQLYRLVALCLVPDEHPIRNAPDDRLARQMIPAPDAQGS